MKFTTYSSLNAAEKNNSLFRFFDDFSIEFGEKIKNNHYNFYTLDKYFESEGRDSIILEDEDLIAVQQYLSEGKDCYAEGIYVAPEYRRQGYSKSLRTVLFEVLKLEGIERFWIGTSEKYSSSSPVKPRDCSQGLAKRDLKEYGDAIIQINKTPAGNVLGYGIDLTKIYERPKIIVPEVITPAPRKSLKDRLLRILPKKS
jgi:GNAT superfamily N-acetyltransferase